MAQDETSRPPMPGRTKTSVAEKLGVPPERIQRFSLNPWEWAAARGLKPLPGREIPPEYRHLFDTEEPEPPAPLPISGRPGGKPGTLPISVRPGGKPGTK